MKFLDNLSFEAINSQFTIESGDCQIMGRIESYSCKMSGEDKQMFKQFCQEGLPHALEPLSPPQSFGASANNQSGDEATCPLSDKCSQKTVFHLLATLDASFGPDYDFSRAKSQDFSREPSVNWVLNAVNSTLTSAVGAEFSRIQPQLWQAIDDEICLSQCGIYSYNPDMASDPYGEVESLWSFNYFFYNKRLKRIVFLTCRSVSISTAPRGSGIDSDWELELDEDSYEEDNVDEDGYGAPCS
ncbi:hypothetical protein AAFF_G00144360 [Aldrovandia affinis]|uniref:Repressor of RNA polymerase III transcription MAF1 n=1 Tax=Aldrovandia affinis TaxID=143900 RepID=A0AAD7WXT7_9TELE|nr:hypothetical protein AAFF_G00144360 [Aldrovandia affinis]